MPVSIKDFSGRLNLDDSAYVLPKGDFVGALNITRDQVTGQNDLVISNIKGNRIVSFNLPSGTNKVIGAKGDVLRGKIYIFIYNSNGKHTILQYVDSTRTITKLLQSITDSDGVDILAFSVSDKINHIGIIHRDDDEGDLVLWTDGVTSPKKINVKHLLDGDYSIVKLPFIEAAKAPFLSPPAVAYGSDPDRSANSLRKKLFQFSARPQYDDFEKATFSAYSKVPLPNGYYGSDNDIDNTKNNFITVSVETGDVNVIAIEVMVRFSIGDDNWSDWLLAAALNKEQLGIPDNTTYDFLFYNDAVYYPIDPEESDPLFDWLPRKAKAQCLPNGNVVAYGAITENFDNIPINELDVTITTENIKNVPPDADPAALTYYQSGNTWTFTVSGAVPVGTRYRIIAIVGGTSVMFADYTSVGGDTTADVADGLRNYIIANYAGYAGSITLNSFLVVPPGDPSFRVIQIFVDAGTSAGSISTEKTWLWDANYIFGIVYVDEQNRDMPGVTTFANPTDVDNDFVVTTDSFSLDSTDVETPVISAEINHLPPAGAVKYYWVRRRQTYGNFLFYETCDYQSDSDYLYFCLANIEQFKEDNSQFIYGAAPIASDSRIKVIAGITSGNYDGDVWNQDYEILGTVTRTLTSGTSPADDKTFIKVKKPTASISPAYKVNMLVMVYTPLANPTELSDSVYWEWGEAYDIYTGRALTYGTLAGGTFDEGETITGGTSGATAVVVTDNGTTAMSIKSIVGTFVVGETITGGTSAATAVLATIGAAINYHAGMDKDQTEGQAAEFTWEEGDVYFHTRKMYDQIRVLPYSMDDMNIMDANFSDFFSSAVNDNGRGHVIEVNAKDTYNPVLVRFGGAYQNGTSVNNLNKFLAENFDEYDRNYGDIFILDVIGSYMKVGQRFKIGNVPILLQIIRDSNANDTLGTSDQLLNKIVYYNGDYGVGDCPEAWAGNNFTRYFVDNNRGVVCRLSQDGVTPISILYKINSWATEKLPLRGGAYKVYGAFDSHTNKYIMALEATLTDPAYTMAFDEVRNAFEGERSFQPEWMVSLGTLFCAFKSGQLWTFDSPDKWNHFFGVQYPSSITGVFNDQPLIKKVFNSIGYQSDSNVWESPTLGDIATNSFNTQTGLQQQSKLSAKLVDYDRDGQYWYAALLRDANSMTNPNVALYEGDFLAGTNLTVKFSYTGNKFAWLFAPYVTYQIEQKNF